MTENTQVGRLQSISNTLFSELWHSKLRYVSELFAYSNLQVKNENDVIAFWKWSKPPISFSGCYKGIEDPNNIIPPKYK